MVPTPPTPLPAPRIACCPLLVPVLQAGSIMPPPMYGQAPLKVLPSARPLPAHGTGLACACISWLCACFCIQAYGCVRPVAARHAESRVHTEPTPQRTHTRTHNTVAVLSMAQQQQPPAAPNTHAPHSRPHSLGSSAGAAVSAAHPAPHAHPPPKHSGGGGGEGDVGAKEGHGMGGSGQVGVQETAAGERGAANPTITYGAPSSEAAVMFAVRVYVFYLVHPSSEAAVTLAVMSHP